MNSYRNNFRIDLTCLHTVVRAAQSTAVQVVFKSLGLDPQD